MGSKQAKYVNDSDANDASMLKDIYTRAIVFYVRMPLAFVTRSSQGTHGKVNGRFKSWTVINYRDTQQRGAYVRMFGVL